MKVFVVVAEYGDFYEVGFHDVHCIETTLHQAKYWVAAAARSGTHDGGDTSYCEFHIWACEVGTTKAEEVAVFMWTKSGWKWEDELKREAEEEHRRVHVLPAKGGE